MKHLSAEERLALIEALDEPRHPHLAACDRCRAAVAAARAVLLETRALDVPEPSPLFWDRFSARVSARLDEAPAGAEAAARIPWRILVPLAVGVMGLVMAVAVERERPAPATALAPAAAWDAALADAGPAADDDAWSVLGHLAGDFDVETLNDSLGGPMSGAESALWDLSENERAELTRLLRAEMQPGRSGS